MLSSEDVEFNESYITLIIIAVLGVEYNVIIHFCGKRNFKALDEESADDNDESEEE